MTLDIVGVTLIILFFIRGYMKGIIVAAFSVLAILLGLICSLKLSEKLATYLHDKGILTSGWAPLISYAILFIGITLLVRLLAKAVETSVKAVMLGWLNRTAGGLLFAFLAAVLWSSLLWIGSKMMLISPETIAASHTYEYIEPLAPWFFDKVGLLWPMAKDIFGNLDDFFDNVNHTMPEHVGADR